jgi:hypothetical protein
MSGWRRPEFMTLERLSNVKEKTILVSVFDFFLQ